jgi:small subunit ribosomal protein S16
MRFRIRKVFRDIPDFGPLRIRLQRFGRANYAFYNIVVAQARFRRNGRSHAILGTYCPHATDEGYKHVNLDFERTKEWLAAGAHPTGMVAKLLSKVCTLYIHIV